MFRQVLSPTFCAFGVGVAAAIGAWQLSTADASDHADPMIRPLVILADSDPEIGATVMYDATLIRLLLDQKKIAVGRVAAPVALLESRDELTISTIFQSIETMETGESDTLFCFYSGRGGARDDGTQYLQLPGNVQLTRATLLSVLKAKGARLTLVLTDSVSPSAVLPLPGEELILTEKQVLPRLLLNGSGCVDINSFHASQVGHYFQQTTADGATSRGSLLIREFFRECAVGKSTVDAAPSWRVFGEQLEKNMVASLRIAAKLAGKSSLRSQTPQVVIEHEQLPQITNSIGMKLVLVPAGEFLMGSHETAAKVVTLLKGYHGFENVVSEKYEDEHPLHRVRITKPFYLSKHEVTVGQFKEFVADTGYRTEAETDGRGGDGFDVLTNKFEQDDPKYSWRSPGFPQTDDHPVVNVSWNDARAFCRWLSRRERKTYGLPSEAQWEYACRAGTVTRFSCGNDAEDLTVVGNVYDASAKARMPDLAQTISTYDGYAFTAPVGRFQPNAFGLYDMHGNVAEWCADWYDEEYYSRSPTADPAGFNAGTSRVFRGGSCFG